MEQSIAVRFKTTLQDVLELESCHRRITVRPALRAGWYIASGFLVALGAYGLFRGIGSSTFVFIAGCYYPALRPLERRWQVERAFKRDPDKDLEVEWQISELSLKVKSSKWATELTWPAITRAFATPSSVLLYVSETPFLLPRRGFSDRGAFEQLVELLRTKVSGFSHVR
jgi:hypothetical protein